MNNVHIEEGAATAALAGSDRSHVPEAEHFRGTLIWHREPEYEDARTGRVFNMRTPERFPAAVLFAEGVADVVAAMQLAARHAMKVSVRSGGHSWDAWSLRDGSLLIDLGRMRELSYDTGTEIVTASPAICGGELNPYLKPFGVFFPGGHCPSVGLGGFLLQGGMGWNCRGWGWAAERIAGMDVVLPDGSLVRASDTENAEVFWAARGSGPGFFGVVVRFYLRPRPLPKAFTRTTFVFPMTAYDEVMPWLQRVHGTLHSSIELVAIGLHAPIHGAGGPSHQHSLVVHALTFSDTEDDARAALAPMEQCPAQDVAFVRDICVPVTMEQEYEQQMLQNPRGMRYAADNAYLSGPADEVVPALKECFETLPTVRGFALWYSMAPLTRLSGMALSMQGDVYFAIYNVWESPEDDRRCRDWQNEQMARIEKISDGYYLGDSDIPTRSSKFMADANFARLQQLRSKYDPDARMCSYREHEVHALNDNPWQTSQPET